MSVVLGFGEMETGQLVLVVDDEPRILRTVRTSLTLAGYRVLTTASGEDAVKLVKLDKPDLVLLDVVMQPVDGLEVLRRIRAFSQVPVLLFTVTRYTDSEVRDLGANGLVAKPYNPQWLAQKIKDVLAGR